MGFFSPFNFIPSVGLRTIFPSTTISVINGFIMLFMASFSVLSLPFAFIAPMKSFIREWDTWESMRAGLLLSKKGAICLFRTHLYLSKVCGNISPASFFCSTQCQSSAIKGVFSPSRGRGCCSFSFAFISLISDKRAVFSSAVCRPYRVSLCNCQDVTRYYFPLTHLFQMKTVPCNSYVYA